MNKCINRSHSEAEDDIIKRSPLQSLPMTDLTDQAQTYLNNEKPGRGRDIKYVTVIALDAVELYKLSNAVSFHIWDT